MYAYLNITLFQKRRQQYLAIQAGVIYHASLLNSSLAVILQAPTCPEEKKNKRSITYPTTIFVFFYKTTETHILKINSFRQYYSHKSSIQQ
jgi:hypothetical protein